MRNTETIHEYDDNGNMIHYRDRIYETWNEFDENCNVIHHRNNSGFEIWHEYDANGKLIHSWTNCGTDAWYWEGKRTEDPIAILILKKRLREKVTEIKVTSFHE